MARLNRKEMQQQTRRRILAAAEQEIARRGIEAASLREIAEAAGYSLGAFYSNFRSKEELLRELLATHMEREMELIRGTLVEGTDSSPARALARLEMLLAAMRQDEVLSGLIVEFHLYASRNPAFRQEFYRSKNQRLEAMADGLAKLFQRCGVELSIDARQLAQGFSALWVGFAIQGKEGAGDCAEEVTLYFFESILKSAPPIAPADGKTASSKNRCTA